jgi:hypothetical protein
MRATVVHLAALGIELHTPRAADVLAAAAFYQKRATIANAQ